MRRRRAERTQRDAGITLTELMVTIAITGIVTLATVALTIGMARTNAENISRQDQIDVARSSVERMSKTLRTAVKPSQLHRTCVGCEEAFLVGQANQVRFFANLDNPDNSIGPSRITYAVTTEADGTMVLVEKVQTPDSERPGPSGYVYCNAEATGASSACKDHLTTRILARGLVLDGPLFTYRGPDGLEMVPGGSGLTVDQLQKIMSIEVTITVQTPNVTTAQPTTYIQRILLPNSHAVLRVT